ncbi:MAG: uracil-DNA glycosylase, partial [Collinsella sp.]
MRAEQTIYPAQDDILNALAYTPADQVKVVILGQDPYHGPNQAMGLSFSVPATQTKLPPSLHNIYKELKADLGCPIPATGDLTPWAQQGVLLLNTTLTVREHAANSHAKLGWSTLTDYVIERCCQLPQPVVFLAWGRFAQQMVEGKL